MLLFSHPGCECQGGFHGDHCEYLAPGTSESESFQKSTMIGLLAITSLFMAAGLYILYNYSKNSRRLRVKADADNRSKALSGQHHFGNGKPWRDGFDEDDDDTVLSLRGDDHDFSPAYRCAIKQPTYSEFRVSERRHEGERRCGSSASSGGPISTAGTLDSDDHKRDSVVRFAPPQLKTPSFGSTQSDSLHVFNDSNDGSVSTII